MFSKKIAFLSLGLVWFFQLLIGVFIIYLGGVSQAESYIKTVLTRAKEDVIYKDGKWDTVFYNSDPNVPGDAHPLYILTSDGFVIDRWRPIKGFLDTSDFKRLLNFNSPQTIHTVTNQAWRIFSKPVNAQGKIIGVITVSYFNPSHDSVEDVDALLMQNADYIASKLRINGQEISANRLDIRTIPYDISFQIVNVFNEIVIKNNNSNSIDRLPNFIDPSYVDRELHAPQSRIILDSDSHEHFILLSAKILDNQSNPAGIILAGKSIQEIYNLLYMYVASEFMLGLIILIGLLFFFKINKDTRDQLTIGEVKSLRFDKKEGTFYVNERHVRIPFATNQYYLCDAIFSHPKKKWESDELLKKFGEEESAENARKVYDTMLLFNRKASHLLVEKVLLVEDKRYFLNPKLVSLI